jgi:hypothetical protein
VTTVIQVIDAVVADINALALPTHRTFKYAKARALRMDLGNWLMVFPTLVNASLETTNSAYTDQLHITIEWDVPAFKGVEGQIEDQAVALTHLATSQLIADRLRTYGEGVPGLTNVTAVLDQVNFDLDTGLVWEATHVLRVELFEGF